MQHLHTSDPVWASSAYVSQQQYRSWKKAKGCHVATKKPGVLRYTEAKLTPCCQVWALEDHLEKRACWFRKEPFILWFTFSFLTIKSNTQASTTSDFSPFSWMLARYEDRYPNSHPLPSHSWTRYKISLNIDLTQAPLRSAAWGWSALWQPALHQQQVHPESFDSSPSLSSVGVLWRSCANFSLGNKTVGFCSHCCPP